MTSINTSPLLDNNVQTTGLPGLQSQLASLQKQCADWESCATTPATEKAERVSLIQQQIGVIEGKIARQKTSLFNASGANDVQSFSSTNGHALSQDPSNQTSIQQTVFQQAPADGVNRPVQDPSATVGSLLNTYI